MALILWLHPHYPTRSHSVNRLYHQIQQKSKIMHNLSESESRQKMIAFLARRGFSWETISQVLKIN